MHVSEIGKRTDWKMYLVQELCHASLADILVVGMLHNKETRKPHQVILIVWLYLNSTIRPCQDNRDKTIYELHMFSGHYH